MLKLDLQRKIVQLQNQLNVNNSAINAEFAKKLDKFGKQIDKSCSPIAKDWQVLAAISWEKLINKIAPL